MIGRNVEKFPDLAERMVAAGHELGNHSYSHTRMVFGSYDFMRSEIERTDALIRSVGYTGPIHFRSPYGKKLLLLPLYLWRAGTSSRMRPAEAPTRWWSTRWRTSRADRSSSCTQRTATSW